MPGPTGTVPLRSVQVAYETTRGTLKAATRVMPFISADMNIVEERSRRMETRASYARYYKAPITTKEYVELSGMEVVPTFEELPWYLGCAIKGGTVPSGTADISAYTWAYTPTMTSDNTYTASFEIGSDTTSGSYKLNFGVLNRLELGYDEGNPMTMTMDWLFSTKSQASITGALSAATAEEIAPVNALAYIDTSTIGTTLVTEPQSFRFSIDNKFVQLFAPNGNAYPVDVYRSEPRTMHLEMSAVFTSATEYAAYLANTYRKIRLLINGSVVGSTTAKKYLQIDWYGYWDEAPQSTTDGMVMARFVGDSVYDTTAATDFSITVRNGVSTLS